MITHARDTKSRASPLSSQATAAPPLKAPTSQGTGSIERALRLATHSLKRGRGSRAAAHARNGGRSAGIRIASVAHPLAEAVARSDTRFRLPTFADLKAVYTDKKLNIPEAVFKDRVGKLLGRMERDKRLKSKDPVPTILSKIFPAPGTIDETEFNAAIDVADRTKIYQSVLDADTTIKPADKPALKTAAADAVTLMGKVEKDAAGLKAVFGTKDTIAKTNYGKAQTALANVFKDLDKHASTDYNLDDPEVGLGGWARFSTQDMHLLVDIVKVTDVNETKATLIHESSHLSDSSVDDKGYYGTANFEALPEDVKVTNAAHYEELPRREMKTSKFPGLTFTPGKLKSGAAPTWEDNIRRAASETLRSAWDAAVDAHDLFRRVRKDQMAGSTAKFTAKKVLLLEMSKLMDLTIHEQDPANQQVSALDITLSESIAHGTSIISDLVQTQPVVVPGGVFASAAAKDKAATDLLIANTIARYGRMLGDPARDKKLIEWLAAHIGAIL